MQDYRIKDKKDERSLAFAYVPWQHFVKIYDDLEKAYKIGTIFPELNMPFTGNRF